MGEQRIHLVVFGDIGHGKTTLIARILLESGRISREVLEKIRKQADDNNKPNAYLAWLLDRGQQERLLGHTYEVRYRDFQIDGKTIWLIDTPGDEEHVDKLAAAISEADAGLLTVSVDVGWTEKTVESAILGKMLGVNQIIVVLTKIDKVSYSQLKIEKLQDQLLALLQEIGYQKGDIKFVPVSGLENQNIKVASSKMKWYKGHTLFEELKNLRPPKKLLELPFRLPIDSIYFKPGYGPIVCGKILTGSVKMRDEVIVEPGASKGRIVSIEELHKEQAGFEAGDSVGIQLKGIVSEQIDIGYVISHVANPPKAVSKFSAVVTVLHYPMPLRLGDSLVLHVHTAQVNASIYRIDSRLDPKNESVLDTLPKILRPGEKGIVQIKTEFPVVIETRETVPALSRFVLRAYRRTIAAGVCINAS